MMEGTEETIGGRCRKLFHSQHDHHLTAADADAPDEYVETIYNEGGVEVCKIWHRCEVVEGQQKNGFVQGGPEDPRDASQV